MRSPPRISLGRQRRAQVGVPGAAEKTGPWRDKARRNRRTWVRITTRPSVAARRRIITDNVQHERFGRTPGFAGRNRRLAIYPLRPRRGLALGRTKQRVVAAEQPARHLEDAVGDEQRGEHVDRVVIVAEQHDRAEERSQRQIEHPPWRDVPEGECGEQRQAGVSGKEQVAAVEDRVEERRGLLRVDRRRRDMGERHEHRADQQEQRHGLERERQPVRPPCQQARRDDESREGAVDEQKAHVEGPTRLSTKSVTGLLACTVA